MAAEFVDQLRALVARADPALPRGSSLEVEHFFGGAAVYVDGRIFMSLTKVGLALKLPEEDRRRLFRSKQAKKLRYFPKAPIKREYVLFPRDFLDECDSVKTWIERSVVYAVGND